MWRQRLAEMKGKKGDRGARGERLLWYAGRVSRRTGCVGQSLKEVPAASVN